MHNMSVCTWQNAGRERAVLQGTSASPAFINSQDQVCLGFIRMMSLNCRDLGIARSFELTGMNEQEIMRKFIVYAEDELKMPVLSSDTILRVHRAIKK